MRDVLPTSLRLAAALRVLLLTAGLLGGLTPQAVHVPLRRLPDA